MQLGTEHINRINQLYFSKEPFFFLSDYKCQRVHIHKLSELPEALFIQTPSFSNFTEPTQLLNPSVGIASTDKEAYRRAFNAVVEELKQGNSYLLNLCWRTAIHSGYSLEQLFYHSKAPYKLLFDNQFVVFSPEQFIELESGQLSTYPMKGTIEATLPDAANQLLENPKEFSEHCTIVDLMRNDLSAVAEQVRVEKFRYLQELKTSHKHLLQTSSKIQAQLKPEYGLGDVLGAMLPAGSITGAPKAKTCQIIDAVENAPRNYYCGVFGIFDGQRFDSAVLIRFVEKEGNQLYYRSGGGITSQSQFEEEYRELLDKIYVPIH